MTTKKESREVKVTISALPNSEVKVFIVVPVEEFEEFIDKAAQELSKSLKVDGFRKGKVPKNIVEKTVGSEQLLYDGAEQAVRKTYVDAIIKNKIEAIGQPKVDLKKIARGNDLEFEAVVAVLPKLSLKEGWKEEVAKVNKEYKEKKIEVKDSEIKREVEFLAKQRAKIITVNRSAKKGDQTEVDFQVSVDKVPIEGGTAKKHAVIIGEGHFIPGFEENLVGMKAGDNKKFELSFPKEYHQANLAGKKATFDVTVNLVQERQLPELNDEFASSIGKFENMGQLEENIKKGIAHELEHKYEDEQKRKIIEKVIEKVEVELPSVLVDSELQTMLSELEQEVSMMGLDLPKYFDQLKTSEQKMKEQWREKGAPERVTAALAVREIAKMKEIEPESKEVEERMNKIMQYYKTVKNIDKQIDLERLYESTKGALVNEKVFQYFLTL